MKLHFTVKDLDNISTPILNNINKSTNNTTIMIWDNKSFEEYIKEKDRLSYNCFMKLNRKFGAMIGDYIRYSVLYYEGGVYMDAKSGIKNTDMQSFIVGKTEGLHVWKWTQKSFDEYLNWFIICDKGNKIMKKVIDTINNNIDNYNPHNWTLYKSKQNVLRFTGPLLFTKVLIENEDLDKLVVHTNLERRKFLRYEMKHYKEYYIQQHYSKVKEHLIKI